LLLRNSSIEECFEYSCWPASWDGLIAPQCDLHSPTSTLTGLPEISEKGEKKKKSIHKSSKKCFNFIIKEEILLEHVLPYLAQCTQSGSASCSTLAV